MNNFEDIVNSIKLEDNFDILLSAVGTVGEAGEYANLIKKLYRDNIPLDQLKENISDEIADIMIYNILNAKYFGIDIIEAISNKLIKNEKKRSIRKKYEYSMEEGGAEEIDKDDCGNGECGSCGRCDQLEKIIKRGYTN